MIGLGTVVNCIAIIIGGIVGCTFGNVLKEQVRDGLMKAMGLAVMFVGISGALKEMLVIEDGILNTQTRKSNDDCFFSDWLCYW